MKKLATMFIAVTVMLAIAAPLYAAEDMKQSPDSSERTGVVPAPGGNRDLTFESNEPAGAAQALTAEKLKGMDVVSQTGEEIGTIKEIRIDEQSGDIKFVTLSKGGFLGIGGEEYAVPLGALSFGDDRATLAVDESKLETAPQQSNLSDEEYQRDLQTHYGVSPAWQEESAAPDMNKTESMEQDQRDMDATNMEGQDPAAPVNRESDFHQDSNKDRKDY